MMAGLITLAIFFSLFRMESDRLLQEQTIFPIPSSGALSSFRNSNAYLDIVPTPEGYNHIALFNPADSSQPMFLTSGDWEVTGRIHGVDSKKGLV
jgi:dipeptidyl aminopeptidase